MYVWYLKTFQFFFLMTLNSKVNLNGIILVVKYSNALKT